MNSKIPNFIEGLCWFGVLVFVLVLLRLAFSETQKPAARRGLASWYGASYRGSIMANGKPFDPDALTAASWDFPLGAVVRVRAVTSGNWVLITITDRGPSKTYKARGRIIDLSEAAFRRIAGLKMGVIYVDVEETGGAK